MTFEIKEWHHELHSLNEIEAKNMIAWLFGRSGISDELFIEKCKEVKEEE